MEFSCFSDMADEKRKNGKFFSKENLWEHAIEISKIHRDLGDGCLKVLKNDKFFLCNDLLNSFNIQKVIVSQINTAMNKVAIKIKYCDFKAF